MKKIILIVHFICIVVFSTFGQHNNPMDAEGIKIINQVKYMINEAKSGKITTLDKSVINKYSAELNMDNDLVPVDQVAGQTYQAISNPQFNFINYVNNSNFNQLVKDEIIGIYNIQRNSFSPITDFQSTLVLKVTQINENPSYTNDEKKMLLILSSLKYHTPELVNLTNANYLVNAAYIGNVSKVDDGIYIGGCIGGIIGSLFSWPAGTAIGMGIGAVVGAIIGSIS
jgi:hypothetical protein